MLSTKHSQTQPSACVSHHTPRYHPSSPRSRAPPRPAVSSPPPLSTPSLHPSSPATTDPVPLVRALVGGLLMGLANLVPGVSGGTMLVAAGIYDRFIQAIASITRLRWTRSSVLLLGAVVLGATIAIGGGAQGVSFALAEYRWQTYCVFIGLTIGGLPAMWAFCKPISRTTWLGVTLGILVMLALVLLQTTSPASASPTPGASNWLMLILGGTAGAGAMILPGVSGAYLLLLLGQYEIIVDSIRATVSAATSGDVSGVLAQANVLIPVGIGVLIGIVGVSNLLRLALRRARNVTLGVLLGLLLAAPAGLWPFKQATPPTIGDIFEGQPVTQATLAEVQDPSNAKHWPTHTFRPTGTQIGLALGLIAAGAAVTLGVAAMGSRLERRQAARGSS